MPDDAPLLARVGRPPVRPSVTDPEAVKRLCDYLAAGMTMAAATSLPECPTKDAVYAKAAKDPGFAMVIARAREAQQDAYVDQMVALADAATPETWQVARLQIWARQWTAEKVSSRKYGARTMVGGDPDNPLMVEHRLTARRDLLRRLDALADPEPLTIDAAPEPGE
jgi:hypothetical protein